MRRFILAVLLITAITSSVGCFIPIYATDPVERTEELIFTSEELRQIRGIW